MRRPRFFTLVWAGMLCFNFAVLYLLVKLIIAATHYLQTH